MHCIYCNADDTKVVDSRLGQHGSQVKRRRECVACSQRFTTYETADQALPQIVKRGGERSAFDEAKLRNGIKKALEKRPVNTEAVEEAIGEILCRLRSISDREVDSATLGDWVMEALKKLDRVAYIRFASVYRNFQDVEEFRQALDRLEEQH